METSEYGKESNHSEEANVPLQRARGQQGLLVGDFTQWQENAVPMQKGKDGVWEAKVALPLGEHPYRFIVDGEWRDDPECPVRVPNPFGASNCVRAVE